MAEQTILDQGTVWWPSGVGKHEQVSITFNIALTQRPTQVTVQDYETREPMESDVLAITQSGSGDWARYTTATIRFPRSDQRGRSFRWRAT